MRRQDSQKLTAVVRAIRAAGYDPYTQLTGYVTTGNPAYITRRDDARATVTTISPAAIRQYLEANGQMGLQ